MRGTKSMVMTRSARRPIVLTRRVVEKWRRNGAPPAALMMYDPDRPTPSRMLSMGPPKHAEKPMTGAKAATARLATKSARLFPTAKIVSPMIASERPKMWPNV